MAYYRHKTVRLSVVFSDGNTPPAYFDPVTVNCYIQDPRGRHTTYSTTVVHDSAGHYHLDVVPDLSGWWTYQWEGLDPAFEGISPPREFFVAAGAAGA